MEGEIVRKLNVKINDDVTVRLLRGMSGITGLVLFLNDLENFKRKLLDVHQREGFYKVQAKLKGYNDERYFNIIDVYQGVGTTRKKHLC